MTKVSLIFFSFANLVRRALLLKCESKNKTCESLFKTDAISLYTSFSAYSISSFKSSRASKTNFRINYWLIYRPKLNAAVLVESFYFDILTLRCAIDSISSLVRYYYDFLLLESENYVGYVILFSNFFYIFYYYIVNFQL